MNYLTDINVCVREISTANLLAQYYRPTEFADSCATCPFYGQVWSCPPETPDCPAFFAPYSRVFLIGVKAIYSAGAHDVAVTPDSSESVRASSYGAIKRLLNGTLRALQANLAPAGVIAAGRCEECVRCARVDGLPCRHVDRMRVSFSALRFDLGRIADEQLHMPLLWKPDGLPPYQVAIAALLLP